MAAPIYVVLLHYPITNRQGETITTAVTNLDIHDISRSARTFGARGYFIVTPIDVQRALVDRILSHWRAENQKAYHPDRYEAISRVRLVRAFEDVVEEISRECGGQAPEVVMPDARPLPKSISYSEYRKELEAPGRTRPAVIVFGTGWGISETFFPVVDRILTPVYGPEGREGYNHLSVRAAAAIVLDRLLGI